MKITKTKMTSRTIDIYCNIYCNACRKYMFSLQPDNKGIAKDYYCKKIECQLQAVADKLKKIR